MGELKLGKHLLRTPAVCGAVMGKDVAEMRSGVSRAVKQGADLIELRIDSLQKSEGWEKLIRDDMPTIFTNRAKREGGAFKGSEEKRIDLILDAVRCGVSCVDIELSTPEKLRDRVISKAKRSGVTVLMSYHNFSATPSVEDLIDIARKMAKAGGGIVKVVTFAKNLADSMRLLDFLIDVQDEVAVPVIALAMGEAGRLTRLTAPLLGSPITYANVGEPTAPGQLGVAETKKLLRKLVPKEG